MKNKMMLLLALIAASSGVVVASDAAAKKATLTKGSDIPADYFNDFTDNFDAHDDVKQDLSYSFDNDFDAESSSYKANGKGDREARNLELGKKYAEADKRGYVKGTQVRTAASKFERQQEMSELPKRSMWSRANDFVSDRYSLENKKRFARKVTGDVMNAGALGLLTADIYKRRNNGLEYLLNNTALGQSAIGNKYLRKKWAHVLASILQTIAINEAAGLVSGDGGLASNGVRYGWNKFKNRKLTPIDADLDANLDADDAAEGFALEAADGLREPNAKEIETSEKRKSVK
ncbi:MAG: hypothetical protein QG632_576 [Candidatus Dependentiae bacterium]|nr:hypothetical protein [Candidatus Dependentiae bacterium]